MKFINKNDPHLTLPYLKMIPQQNGRAPLTGYKQTQSPLWENKSFSRNT